MAAALKRENRDGGVIGFLQRKDKSRRILKIAFIDDQKRLEIFHSCRNNGPVDEPGRWFWQVGNDHTENVKISADQMDAASCVPAAQLCSPVQSAQDLANDLHAVADHMTGAPFDAHQAARTVKRQDLNSHAMVGNDHAFFCRV